jgi:hypothetical protein
LVVLALLMLFVTGVSLMKSSFKSLRGVWPPVMVFLKVTFSSVLRRAIYRRPNCLLMSILAQHPAVRTFSWIVGVRSTQWPGVGFDWRARARGGLWLGMD